MTANEFMEEDMVEKSGSEIDLSEQAPSNRLSRDEAEMITLADLYLSRTRCVGEHLVVEGYVCPHCNSAEPSRVCTLEKVIYASDRKDCANNDWRGWTLLDDRGRPMKQNPLLPKGMVPHDSDYLLPGLEAVYGGKPTKSLVTELRHAYERASEAIGRGELKLLLDCAEATGEQE